MQVLRRPQLERALAGLDLLPLLEAGFVAYSEGRAVVPPVGELLLDEGEVHIKYGFIRGHEYYVIKVASGFYGNAKLELPSSNGMMLLFRQQTGEPVAVLADEGHLTDVRTAVAGAIGAKYLARSPVRCVGIVGTGTQARLQLRHTCAVTSATAAVVWGRNVAHAEAFATAARAEGLDVTIATTPAELAAQCDLIVTTTPSTRPLLFAADVRPGTHITAIGSDAPHKQELDPGILSAAGRVVADSIAQCRERGEIARALAAGALTEGSVVELGDVIAGRAAGRDDDEQITVFDSTGVAVQDIQIAVATARALGID